MEARVMLWQEKSQYDVSQHTPYVTLAIYIYIYIYIGFGGLGVACWPLVPKFAGRIFRAKKSSAHLPSEGK